MKKTPLRLLFLLLAGLPGALFAQTEAPVEVCDITLRFKGDDEQELYYGFAKGDRIVFSFREMDGQALASVEIAEYPDQVRFQELQTASIDKKVISVPSTAVYRFKFKNDRKEKFCKVIIQRIPASQSTRGFRTSVKWVEKYDTIYQNKTAALENQLVSKTRRVITRVDTAVVSLIDKTERVHSRSNLSVDNVSKVKVELPKKVEEADRVQEMVSWAYWIGVGKEAEGQYVEANRLSKLAKSATSAVKSFGMLAGPYGALASLAIDGISFFTAPIGGDNVKYVISAQDKVIDQGDGTSAYARNTTVRSGGITFELTNDNYIDVVDVNLRVVAVTVIKYFKDEVYYEQQQTPVWDKEVKVTKIPVVSN